MYLLLVLVCFFFFKQKTAYEMRISDWSSDVCSSDLRKRPPFLRPQSPFCRSLTAEHHDCACAAAELRYFSFRGGDGLEIHEIHGLFGAVEKTRTSTAFRPQRPQRCARSEEHTSELQSLMRISYAVFCLKKNTTHINISHIHTTNVHVL